MVTSPRLPSRPIPLLPHTPLPYTAGSGIHLIVPVLVPENSVRLYSFLEGVFIAVKICMVSHAFISFYQYLTSKSVYIQVKVHRYWPGKQPANISTLMVEMTSEMVYEDYVMREIKLTNTKV